MTFLSKMKLFYNQWSFFNSILCIQTVLEALRKMAETNNVHKALETLNIAEKNFGRSVSASVTSFLGGLLYCR